MTVATIVDLTRSARTQTTDFGKQWDPYATDSAF